MAVGFCCHPQKLRKKLLRKKLLREGLLREGLLQSNGSYQIQKNY